MSKGILPDVEMYGYPTYRQLSHPERFRFRPQLDEEVRGDLNSPPNPEVYDVPPYHYCEACETTWLVGLDGPESARQHPSHNTRFHRHSGQSRRSMLVHMVGACSYDGDACGKPSCGIFFGPNSSYNISRFLKIPNPTKKAAEILAATAAVRYVRKMFRPKRETIIRSEGGIHLECRWQDGWVTSPLEFYRNNWTFRLIVVTDSKYLVNSLCNDKGIWQLNPNIVHYRNAMGAPPAGDALFVDLLEEIDLLARDGVEVM